ncbi:MAG: response regulator [Gammaproteobacteria bacterium]|nr:response regulator [Gammaproteobacteria bacterium]
MPYNNRVLVIDDDPAILTIFETILRPKQTTKEMSNLSLLTDLLNDSEDDEEQSHNIIKREFDVDLAKQGEEGYEMVKQAIAEGKPYSVLFTDMRMPPGWDGIKTAREVRSIDPSIEIIIVTAYSDAPVSEIVKQVGFTDRLLYLKKPFDDEEVLQLADSLSMRWNLEVKVKGMMSILEGMIDSFFRLKTAFYTSEEIEPFLRETLIHISEFLDTPDVFVVRFQDGHITMKIGLGRFANGIFDTDDLKEMLSNITSNDPITSVLRIDQYIIMPINLQKCQDVIVGLMSEREIEGADKLLDVLARDMSRVFETVTTLSDLRAELDEKDQRIKQLEAKVELLQDDTK